MNHRGQELVPDIKLSYTHSQSVAATSWVVAHNLGRPVSAQVRNTAGEVIEADVTQDTSNQSTITFTEAMAGTVVFV